MNDLPLPLEIYTFLTSKTLGQEEVLRKVAVAIYKHINGLRAGNILLIGNSGTGKTTIMNTIQKFYEQHPALKKHRAMTIMNANMLGGEDVGDVNLNRLFKSLEMAVNNTFGSYTTDEKLREYMENATVCIDEVDKISAYISGKANVMGIAIQQALLTLIEGERVLYETVRQDHSKKRQVRIPVDTSKMFFICGGAFEGLYDQIVASIKNGEDERKLTEMRTTEHDGTVRTMFKLDLKDQVRLSDLFTYGMTPQFISRFSSIGVLEDLGVEELKKILITADDSPLRHSREYFKTMGVDLQITKDALELLATHSVQHTRIGARALREIFGRIIIPFEFDPFSTDKLQKHATGYRLTIDKEVVTQSL